jgi:CRISPR/Cas system-associated endoribonuclease Cas2
MTLCVITYDVRAKNHEYESLYEQLNEWGAAHLQNSVWLADMNGTTQNHAMNCGVICTPMTRYV